MTSTAAPVRHAARSEGMTVLARWGLAARASIYLLVGVLAVAIAFGTSGGEADQRGALQALSRHTGGTVLVLLIGVGLAGYALWRLAEAAFGVAGEGRKAGPRLQSLARAAIYTFLAVSAFKVVAHSGGSQAHQEASWSAGVMKHTGGRWAVGLVGVIVVVCGLVLVRDGLARKFEKHLELGRMSRRTRTVVTALGVVGTAARGLVFVLAGVFVVVAAVQYDPNKAGGLDVALRKLTRLPAGPWLLLAVAVGLMVFGAFGYAEARWQRTGSARVTS